MKLLTDYFALQKQIFEYFGYQEDWKVIPLDDQTEQHWMVILNESGGGAYVYSPDPFTEESVKAGAAIYGGSIYTQRFLPKWVYRGEEYTMVCADTHTDGNKFLMIFDNSKECTDDKLKQLYADFWG